MDDGSGCGGFKTGFIKKFKNDVHAAQVLLNHPLGFRHMSGKPLNRH